MRKRKVIAIIAAGTLALSLAACGSTQTEEVSVDSAQAEETEDEAEETEDETNEEDQEGTSASDTDTDVTEEAKTLYTQMKSYADVGDYDSFAALFEGAEDADIEELYELEYPVSTDDVNVMVIAEDVYTYVGISDYTVSGTYPDSLATVSNYWFAMTVTDEGEWAFTVDDSLGDYFGTTELMPDKMAQAAQAGRNYAWFDSGNYMYLDESAVYTGVVDSRIKFAWQNKDGTLTLGVWLVNGMDEDIVFGTASEITLRDEEHGTILSLTDYAIDTVVEANSSRLIQLKIDADEVVTGTDAWSSEVTASMQVSKDTADADADADSAE